MPSPTNSFITLENYENNDTNEYFSELLSKFIPYQQETENISQVISQIDAVISSNSTSFQHRLLWKRTRAVLLRLFAYIDEAIHEKNEFPSPELLGYRLPYVKSSAVAKISSPLASFRSSVSDAEVTLEEFLANLLNK